MRKLILILPFVLVLAVLGGAIRFTAFIAGETYIPYNPELEGASILDHRARLREGEYPASQDFYFAGTSRTMADFTPGIVAHSLDDRCKPDHPLAGYDLGNVADAYGDFLAALSGAALPRLLVLELMPHAFLRDPTDTGAVLPASGFHRDYEDYKTITSIFEAGVTGNARQILGLGDLVTIRPGQLVLLTRAARNGDDRFARIYYALRNFQGNAQHV